MPKKLRIFISSPGDVGQERLIATRTLERLQGEFAGSVELEPILWEHEPLRASSHFQEQIIPPSQTDIVVCILWSRLGTRLPEQFQRADGTLYSSGTEWEFEDALESWRKNKTPDLMVYRKTAEPHASMSDENALLQRLQQKKALDGFIDRWFGNPKDSFRAAFHTFDSPETFETLLENHLRKLIQERLPQQLTAEGDTPLTVRWHRGSPFRGLEAFDFDHAPVFFGRTGAIAGIRDALVRQAANGCAFVLLFGMSGCGKSSLVRAGVLPTITQPGVIEGIGVWRWSIFQPGEAADLFVGLAHALLSEKALPELTETGLDAHELGALLREAPERAVAALQRGLHQVASEVAAKEGREKIPEARLALMIDQLEELFTRPQTDDRERMAWVHALDALARSGSVWVIATMRSDFYPRCADIPALSALKEGEGQFDVLPPGFAEIGQMIRYPTRAAGLRFEVKPGSGERLDDVLHEAAARDPEALPLLEFTLDELFKQRTEDGILTFAAYERLGGIEGALAQRAEAVFTGLPPEVQATLPSVLRGLVAVQTGSETTITARRVPMETVAATPESHALIDAFIRARLVVTDKAEDGRAVVRVAHEALLRRWPRLQEWIENDLDFLQTRERAAAAALRWREEARQPEFLLPAGKPLADAQDLLSRRDDLDAELITYIETSRNAVDRARRQRTNVTIAVVGAFFAVVTGFGLFSLWQWQKVKQEKQVALSAMRRLTYDIPRRFIDLPGSRPLLRQLFDENQSLLARIGDVQALSEQRINYQYAGDIQMLLGDTEQALQSYRKSLALAQQQAKNPADADAQKALAVCHTKIGDVSLERGEAKAALESYQTGLDILTKLAAKENSVSLRHDLSAGYEKIGIARMALNDLPGALEAYQQDLKLAQEIASNKNDATSLRELALSYTRIGEARLAANDVSGALDAYRTAQTLLFKQAETENNPAVQRELAASYANLGDVYLKTGDSVRALEAFEKSLAQVEARAKDKTNILAQRDLAHIYSKFGELKLATNNAQAALDYYQRSLSIAQTVAQDKTNGAAQQELATLYGKIQDIQLRLGDIRAAMEAREKGLLISLALLKDTKTPEARRTLATLYNDLGATRTQRGDTPGAMEAYRQALDLYQELSAPLSAP